MGKGDKADKGDKPAGKGQRGGARDTVVEFTDDVKVRLMHLPPNVDEKGRKIPYTEKELEKLKGNTNMSGYEAAVSDLKPGQIVKVFLATAKGGLAAEANKLYARKVYI